MPSPRPASTAEVGLRVPEIGSAVCSRYCAACLLQVHQQGKLAGKGVPAGARQAHRGADVHPLARRRREVYIPHEVLAVCGIQCSIQKAAKPWTSLCVINLYLCEVLAVCRIQEAAKAWTSLCVRSSRWPSPTLYRYTSSVKKIEKEERERERERPRGLSNCLVTLGGMGEGSTALKRVDSVRNHFSSSLPLAPFKLKLAT